MAYEDKFAAVLNTGSVTLRVSFVADFTPHEHTILGFNVPDVAATIVNGISVPLIRARIEIEHGNPAKAIELLQTATPYELGWPSGPPIMYLRGEAYLAARKGKEAGAEFQKILDHRGVNALSPLNALAHLGLARAFALTGDTAQSRRAYQDFFALWKDADPDIPILQQAKVEYAKLK